VLIVFRAGFVQELFFRGFAIERLQSLGWPRTAAALGPLAIFALLHYPGGPMNILMSFTLGGILALFYLWRGPGVQHHRTLSSGFYRECRAAIGEVTSPRLAPKIVALT